MEPPSSIQLTQTPTHRQSITRGLCPGNLSIAQKIISTCLVVPNVTIKSLSITEGDRYLPVILPLAPTLTLFRTDYFSSSYECSPTSFLNESINLSHISLYKIFPSQLSPVLSSLRATIQTIEMWLTHLSSKEGRTVLKSFRETSEVNLRSVRWIKINWIDRGKTRFD